MKIETTTTAETKLADGFPTVAVHVRDLEVHEVLDASFGLFAQALPQPDPVTQDLLLVASLVYLIDKAVPRQVAEDRWTREMDVRLPVSEPALWAHVAPCLEDSLAFLTGDEWKFDFVARPQDLFSFAPTKRVSAPAIQADRVTLFSGGLDSLVGTLDQLAADASSRHLLIGHHDATQAAGDQSRLWQILDGSDYAGRTDFRSIRVRPLPSALARGGQTVAPARWGREATLRSRSFLFLALGLYAARALGDQVPLVMPENGFIAINIPLTPSRGGSCSTRTTHPYFLHTMRELTGLLGMTNPIENPLEGRTKGEVLTMCQDQTMLRRLAGESVSCAHASRRSIWRRRSARNCGYCLPCIIRRAAFHKVGQDNGADYGLDFCTGELDLNAPVAGDVAAVLDCLSQVRTRDDVAERVLETGPLGGGLPAAVDLVDRGLDELRVLVNNKGNAEMQRRASIR
jgi:hypothetical protein